MDKSSSAENIEALFKIRAYGELVKIFTEEVIMIASEQDRIKYAHSLLEVGYLSKSSKEFKRIASKWPSSKNKLNYANILVHMKLYDDALLIFEDLYLTVQSNEKIMDKILLDYTTCCALNKKYELGVSVLLNVFKRYKNPLFLKKAIDLRLMEGSPEKTFNLLDQLDPYSDDELQYRFKTACYLIDSKRFEEGKSKLIELVAKFPKEKKLFTHLGDLCLKMRDYQGAVNSFLQVTKIDPSDGGAYQNIATVINQIGRHDIALEYATKALNLDKSSASCYNLLGIIYRKLSMLRLSEGSFLKAINLEPNNSEFRTNLGNTLFELFDLEAAYDEYDKASELAAEPNHIVIAQMAECKLGLGQVDEYNMFKKEFEKNDIYQIGKNNSNVALLVTHGRTGSVFLHSLFDSHPNVITIPGVYLAGWFSDRILVSMSVDFSSNSWREQLTSRVLDIFQPMFSASSKKNVPGNPLGSTTATLAAALGLDTLDSGRWSFELDPDIFQKNLLVALADCQSLSHADLLVLIFKAYHKSYYGDVIPDKYLILYHIHNPPPTTLNRTIRAFPNLKIINSCREPIQNLESWIVNEQSIKTGKIGLQKRLGVVGRIEGILWGYCYRNDLADIYNVRLEDLKNDAAPTLKKLCSYLMIDFDPALMVSTFFGKSYSGPVLEIRKMVSGFDSSSIRKNNGRIFSNKEILLLEVLLWESKQKLGYEVMEKVDYLRYLRNFSRSDIESFTFEDNLFDNVAEDYNIKDTYERKSLVNLLWGVLAVQKSKFLDIGAKS